MMYLDILIALNTKNLHMPSKDAELREEVKEGNWWRFLNYYTELSQLPKQVQDLFTK